MAKTKDVESKAPKTCKKANIGEFTDSLGREDLNNLRDKLNEVISFLNK